MKPPFHSGRVQSLHLPWPHGRGSLLQGLLLSVVISARLVPPREGQESSSRCSGLMLVTGKGQSWSKWERQTYAYGSADRQREGERTPQALEVAAPPSPGPGLAPRCCGEGARQPQIRPHCCQSRALSLTSKGTSQCPSSIQATEASRVGHGG